MKIKNRYVVLYLAYSWLILTTSGSMAATSSTSAFKKLQGPWQAVGMVRGGKLRSFDHSMVYKFMRRAMTIHGSDQPTGSYEYEINANATPMQLDLVKSPGTDQEQRSRIIFGFDAAHLWVCYPPPLEARPDSVATSEANQWTYVVFRRIPHQYYTHREKFSLLQQTFNALWGLSGTLDPQLAAQRAKSAELHGGILGEMWAAYCRRWQLCGFPKDIQLAEQQAKALLPEIEQLAQKGDLNAQFLTALGKQVIDSSEASLPDVQNCLLESSLLGHSPSMLYLAILLELTGQHDQAISWYQMAAVLNNNVALTKLANHCRVAATESEQKGGTASQYLSVARTQTIIGELMERSKRLEEAYYLYSQAAKKNDGLAIFHLSRCYRDGIYVEKNVSEADELLEISAKMDCQAAIRMQSHLQYIAVQRSTWSPQTSFEPSPMHQAREAAARREADRAVRKLRRQIGR